MLINGPVSFVLHAYKFMSVHAQKKHAFLIQKCFKSKCTHLLKYASNKTLKEYYSVDMFLFFVINFVKTDSWKLMFLIEITSTMNISRS